MLTAEVAREMARVFTSHLAHHVPDREGCFVQEHAGELHPPLPNIPAGRHAELGIEQVREPRHREISLPREPGDRQVVLGLGVNPTNSATNPPVHANLIVKPCAGMPNRSSTR